MKEEALKKVVIKDGPSLLEGIICKRWLFEAPTIPLPDAFFTTSYNRRFSAKIYGCLRTNAQSGFTVVLIGTTDDKTITETGFFAMHYDGIHKTGTLEPMEKLPTDLPVLLECCGRIFHSPQKEETPLMDFLRKSSHDHKIALLRAFLDDLYEKQPRLAITRHIINILMSETSCLTRDVLLQTPGLEKPAKNPENAPPDRKIFLALNDVCREINKFLRDINMPGFMECGINADDSRAGWFSGGADGRTGWVFFVLNGSQYTRNTRVAIVPKEAIM
jgi:hypothetical protein